jgi:type III pantothenate kinase
MANAASIPLVVVDIGNSRLKFGVFEHPHAEPLPHPSRAVSLSTDWNADQLAALLVQSPADFAWLISSVNRPAAARLGDWLRQSGVPNIRQLTPADLPLVAEVAHPDKVGMDRLANAVAVNRLREPGEPAIIISMGSALTVDLVNAKGAFAGGAILPGIAMSARALNEFTDLLPLVELTEPPVALGKSTIEAIRSGLYWGALGGVRELVAQLLPDVDAPQIYLTGGAGPLFAGVLAAESPRPAQFVPHLTLGGIALAAPPALPPKGAR